MCLYGIQIPTRLLLCTFFHLIILTRSLQFHDERIIIITTIRGVLELNNYSCAAAAGADYAFLLSIFEFRDDNLK